MRIKLLLILVVVIAAGSFAATPSVREYFRDLGKPHFRTAEVSRGTITTYVRATGTVRSVQAVQVGTFASGPIEALYADFNDHVEKGQLLAKIDDRLYQADVASERAILATRQADVRRVEAMLEQALNEESRGLALHKDDPNFISDTELDQLKFNRQAAEAQTEVARASVEQAEAKLNNSLANLAYTEIRSPVDGLIIDRLVETGQTVTATFATPVLFVVAPDLAGEMYIYAKVDEADIGLVGEAKEAGRPVHFTVDAHPDDVFEGTVKQIRSSSSVVEGVVTFPVVVSTLNSNRKLLPGMTASLFFETEVREDVLRVPNAVISFYPERRHVHPRDRSLLDPEAVLNEEDDEAQLPFETRRRNQRHVWAVDELLLRGIPIAIGISDERYTEVLDGALSEGDRLVVGLETK